MKQEFVFDVEREAEVVSEDMKKLYVDFASGKVKREDADTAANIAGKNLKAISIVLANRMFGGVHLPKLILAQKRLPRKRA
jgi:hypothetical protein